MPETRSGTATPVDSNEFDIISVIKEKFEELKADLLSEIKELINLEVEKAMKKQKEEFKSAMTLFKSVLPTWSTPMMT